VAPREEPEAQRKRLLSSGRVLFVLVSVLLFLGWSTQTEATSTQIAVSATRSASSAGA
jgi:hypothetical protein